MHLENVMNQEDLPVTVIVPVKNEGVHLQCCLRELKRFNQVIVVDSGSSDNTLTVAKCELAEVVLFEWNGCYPKKRNWSLDNCNLQNEWVLFLDADEVVSEGFVDEVEEKIKNTEIDSYWINYSNYFMGVKLRYGIKNRKLALFKHSKGRYEFIDENSWSKFDMEIHEHPIVDGNTGVVASLVKHNDYKGIDIYYKKHLEYASWEAKRFLNLKNEKKNDTSRSLSKRQLFKYKYIDHCWFSYAYFCFQYFVKLGFLDGGPGFHHAVSKLIYFYQVRLLILSNSNE